MRAITRKRIQFLAALLAVLASRVLAEPPPFKALAATRPADLERPFPIVVLSWPEAFEPDGVKRITRFNLYRKIDPSAPYPGTPINLNPIELLSDCAELKAVLGAGSYEWFLIEHALADGSGKIFDPCSVGKLDRDSREFSVLQFLARAYWKIAVALGQGFLDRGVVHGKTYYYEIRGLKSTGSEVVLETGIELQAGVPAELPAPAGLTARAGDSRVLLYWEDAPRAAGYNVYRTTSTSGPAIVNASILTPQVKFDLDGNALETGGKTVVGFLDAVEWSTSGEPTPRAVRGAFVDGPENGVAHSYSVAALDLLGGEGRVSDPISSTPVDKTPPQAPEGVVVTALDSTSSLEVRWGTVKRDVIGHAEAAVKTYRVFRHEQGDDPAAGATAVSGDIAVSAPVPGLLAFADSTPLLRPTYGEKTFFYRVECVDSAGNVSSRSAAAAGYLKDKTPPDPPRNLKGKGFAGFIRITWSLNTEPDMDGYEVYRSLCDKGSWSCAPQDDCGKEWRLLRYISEEEAEAMAEPTFEDHSEEVVDASVCHAYIVKALDRAQNKSGAWPPNPDKPPFENHVCVRALDSKPPEPAIVTNLKARDQAVLVEWLAPAEQDIRGYYVYRSKSETGGYAFVGGVEVKSGEKPKALLGKFTGPSTGGCDTIPLVADPGMIETSFLDRDVASGGVAPLDPKQVYWYKVTGVDQDNNETPVDGPGVAPVSTFTFSRKPAATLAVSVTASESPCALVVSWSPALDSTKHTGFAVFRSEGGGPFRQVGSLADVESKHTDATVLRGTTYSYRVLVIERDGKSRLSGAVAGMLP